jgi:branched-chain amino acid transport system ATP-binding protein
VVAADRPVIRVRELSRRFGGVTAVDGVSMDVAHGERRAIIGPNGAGKTTLFKLVAGQERPTGGAIQMFGRDVTAMSVRARAQLGLGRTFQTASVFDGGTVAENLQLALLGRDRRHHSLWPIAKRRSLDPEGLAAEVGLSDRLSVVTQDLSHGERRQLELGMALAGDPLVLMLDEPAAGLAFHERRRLLELLQGLRSDRTLLLIEHDMEVAFGIATHVTMLHEGRIVAAGTPEEVQDDPTVHRLYLGGQPTETAVSGNE